MAIPDWLSLSQVSGSGDTVITITASTNEQLAERLGSLVISGNTKSVTVPVSQGYYDPADEYLTFEILTSGNVYWRCENSTRAIPVTISYRINGGEWTAITSGKSSYGNPIAVNAGDIVEFKGNNSTYTRIYQGGNYTCGWFYGPATGATYNVSGNIMSMIFGDEYQGKLYFDDSNALSKLFDHSNAISAENLALPATALTRACYSGLFQQSQTLIKAPKVLPATGTEVRSYNAMFYECTALTTTPIISASIMATECCRAMFSGCESLVTPPVMSATTLYDSCYGGMFDWCTSLATAPALPATTLAPYCYNGMFGHCTALTESPVLSAQTLVDGCYYQMFYGCTSLSAITCLATNITATDCTKEWVGNQYDGYMVATAGTFTKAASMSGWSTGYDGVPANWTVVDAT